MRTIATSNGNVYQVKFAWAPTYDGQCMIDLPDARRLPEIAQEFDGLAAIRYVDGPAEAEYIWEGYTALRSIVRHPDGNVQIILAKEV